MNRELAFAAQERRIDRRNTVIGVVEKTQEMLAQDLNRIDQEFELVAAEDSGVGIDPSPQLDDVALLLLIATRIPLFSFS